MAFFRRRMYRRRPPLRRRRVFRRRRLIRQRMKRAINEGKYYTASLNTVFNDISTTTQSVDYAGPITQGDDVIGNRDGRRIFIRSVVFNGYMVVDDLDAVVRLVVLVCRTDLPDTLAFTDVFGRIRGNGVYKVLYDNIFRITTDDVRSRLVFKKYLRVNSTIVYSSAAADSNDTELRVMAISDVAPTHGPYLIGYVKVNYVG